MIISQSQKLFVYFTSLQNTKQILALKEYYCKIFKLFKLQEEKKAHINKIVDFAEKFY